MTREDLPEIKTVVCKTISDADLHIVLSPVELADESLSDFAAWTWTGKGKVMASGGVTGLPVITLTIASSVVDMVPTLVIDATKEALAGLFAGIDDNKVNILSHITYVRPGNIQALPGLKLKLEVSRGTNT